MHVVAAVGEYQRGVGRRNHTLESAVHGSDHYDSLIDVRLLKTNSPPQMADKTTEDKPREELAERTVYDEPKADVRREFKKHGTNEHDDELKAPAPESNVPHGPKTRKMLNEPKGKEMSVLHKHETHHTLTEPMKQEAPATFDKHTEGCQGTLDASDGNGPRACDQPYDRTYGESFLAVPPDTPLQYYADARPPLVRCGARVQPLRYDRRRSARRWHNRR